MRILITADPYLPVPPSFYGGTERVIDILVRGLVSRGHEVTLFAHPGSRTDATLVPYGAPPHFGPVARLRELWQVGSTLWIRRHEYDVIHSFGRLAALAPVLPMRRIPKLQSYQRPIPWRGVRRAASLAGDSVRFTACSSSLHCDGSPQSQKAGRWKTIFNPIELSSYRCNLHVSPDAPLVFLGRIEPIKGAHQAIAVARAAGRRLVIAGNKVPSAQAYFEREIAPHVDGDSVSYIGPVNDRHKDVLLGGAAALLMLVEWDEPFGIVMPEAMACGTPVIGFARGALPEVIRHGLNGYLCRTRAEAIAAIGQLPRIDRGAVRRDCEVRFGDHVVVNAYEALYREMLS
jgi:glycosyltransferase involved in cell wall biosynthesis